jgi:Mg/Co/Ni transporter MgtE
MDSDIVSVAADATAEEVASTIARYDLLSCPVLDEQGRMLGIVTVDDAIDAILPDRLKKQLPRLVRNRHRTRQLENAS